MTTQQPVLNEQNALKEAVPAVSSAWSHRDNEHGFPDPLLDLIAARFRLLGEPLRLKLLAALTTEERNVGELVALTGAGQANVSKHLAALTQGGLVSRRKVGTSIYYAIADLAVSTLCDVVCASVQERFTTQLYALGWDMPTNKANGKQKIGTDKENILEV